MSSNIYVYLDLKIGDEKVGRVIIELYKNIVPKTVANFHALCTGNTKIGGNKLHLKGTKFHRVRTQFLIQGGANIFKNGSNDTSIYGKSFEDENFTLLHDEGAVAMANCGPNTNCTEFFITTVPSPHLDGTNVVFGYVRKGMNVVHEVAKVSRNEDDFPLIECSIEDCGEFKLGQLISDETGDAYPSYPNDYDDINSCKIEDVVMLIKSSGNHYYHKKKYTDAYRKYKKVLRYIDFKPAGLIKIKLQTLLNLAIVKYNKNCYEEVVDICTQVLAIDGDNGKALYRRGRAWFKLKDFDKALIDLHKVSIQFSNNKKISQDIYQVMKERKNYKLQERSICSKMFQ